MKVVLHDMFCGAIFGTCVGLCVGFAARVLCVFLWSTYQKRRLMKLIDKCGGPDGFFGALEAAGYQAIFYAPTDGQQVTKYTKGNSVVIRTKLVQVEERPTGESHE